MYVLYAARESKLLNRFPPRSRQISQLEHYSLNTHEGFFTFLKSIPLWPKTPKELRFI